MKKICLRSCLFSPYLWALAGTPAPPLNVFYGFVFWLGARLRRSSVLSEATQCLNVQITYTLVFFLPIALAIGISTHDHSSDDMSLSLFHRLASGFPLGIISLAGILLLAFFNVRSFAGQALKVPFKKAPRLKFLREDPAGITR